MSQIKPTSSNEIRQLFLKYFAERGHEIVSSSSLIPGNDPTLLFTNAGMVQFKDVFLGTDARSYSRATSSQRCLRAGGKHNDLEKVGYTARHHTFFEMLGNFSFGNYFKREAIQFAWEFLTKYLHLSPEKLWVTVYEEDQEAEKIWLEEMKVDPTRFSRCGAEDNFWSMGPTGPCGPCTEIFYDHGSEIEGGPPGSKDADADRYIEIWNLVFMQYNRGADGTLSPLPKPSVDTGMGFERICAVMQNVHNNYDTDLFKPLIEEAARLANLQSHNHFSLQVIADHIRACSFLIADGVIPGNEGRAYVLRRIIRRAIRHGNKLGINETFFYKLVAPLIAVMGNAYPELQKNQTHIEKILKQEEEQFNITLQQGLKVFAEMTKDLKTNLIPGEIIFKLYDTFGFPADLTRDIAREKNLNVDLDTFEKEMEKQRERSRSNSQFEKEYVPVQEEHATTFTGHEADSLHPPKELAKVIAIYQNGQFTNKLTAKSKGSIILDKTPFYAESGGQVGDQGTLSNTNAFFKVTDTIKHGNSHLHLGQLDKGEINIGDTIEAEIDAMRRSATVLNHTATHVLHMVLKELLGSHVMQKGSLVEPSRLRFDFSHASPLSSDEIKSIEARVNAEIKANHRAKVEISTPDEAIEKGAVALFGEKYGKKVRVVHFGKSVELCGGTHAAQTGDIRFFKITSESGVAAGIRRIEAVTGDAAIDYLENKIAEATKKTLEAENKLLDAQKEIDALQNQLAKNASAELVKDAVKVNDIFVLAKEIQGLDGKSLRKIVDHLKIELKTAVVVLATVKKEKIGIVGGVTNNLLEKISAKDIVNSIALQVGGKGGGRADLAEAGGSKPEALAQALDSLYEYVRSRVM